MRRAGIGAPAFPVPTPVPEAEVEAPGGKFAYVVVAPGGTSNGFPIPISGGGGDSASNGCARRTPYPDTFVPLLALALALVEPVSRDEDELLFPPPLPPPLVAPAGGGWGCGLGKCARNGSASVAPRPGSLSTPAPAVVGTAP